MTTISTLAREAALGHVLLPFTDVMLGRRMMRRFRLLEASERWKPETLMATRDVRVRQVVAQAANEVALYRDLYRTASIDPLELRGVEELVGLPFLTRQELRDASPDRSTRQTRRRTHPACTSGSTGEPLCIREDAITEGWHQAAFLQILTGTGWPLGAPHVQLGAQANREGLRAWKDRVLRCRYLSVADLRDATLDAVLDDIARRDIRFVFGYPAGVAELAHRARILNRDVSLGAVVTWGDRLQPANRATIEATFGCAVRDAYGIGEGVWIAEQCAAGGYHERMLDVVLELVDDAGHPVEPGATGHVVVTRLHAGASPLVRYRTGDLAVRASGPCQCGRPGLGISRVLGRFADTLVTPTGRRLLVPFLTRVLDPCSDIEGFQVVKTRADCLEVRIAVRDATTAAPPPASVIAATDELALAIPDMRIQIRVVDRLPLTRSGKLRFILDECEPDQ